MLRIHSVQPGSPEVEPARTLFAHYRDFLETIASTHCFDFPRYTQEIATLPAAYTGANGELLVAFADSTPAACIAFRTAPNEPVSTCEIKRLFVLPDYRGQGIARTLIAESLTRATTRGFTRAILDTDIISMPAAYATYLTLGFTEYTPTGSHAPSLRFLEKSFR
jgi:GNAT superfamily N-acetyltransferase